MLTLKSFLAFQCLEKEAPGLPGQLTPDAANPQPPPALTYFELVREKGRSHYGLAMFDVKAGAAYASLSRHSLESAC